MANSVENNLNNSLINLINNENLKDILVEGSEITLDSFLTDCILKEIPFFGTLYKGYKATIGIRESIFAKKVFHFLIELKDIPKVKREEFIKKLDNDSKYQSKVGEKLIILIEQLDDIDKPKIIGKLFKATINSEIDYEMFLRLSLIVNKSFLPDLIKLKYKGRFTQLIKEHFAMLGLMSLSIAENDRDKKILSLARLGGENKQIDIPPILNYEPNNLAELLIKYGLS